MVVIRHEPPDQRRHIRSEAPLGVRFNEIPCTVRDWSLSGFRIDNCPSEQFRVGDRLSVQLTLQFQDLEVSFPTEVEVARLEDDTLVARFISLAAQEKEVLG